jgi:hypothetical protein
MYGTTTVIDSTLAGNTAQGGSVSGNLGGGGNGLGGAIFNLDGTVNLIYATVAENTVTAGSGASKGAATGGAVYNLSFGNTQAGGATTATLTLFNSVLGQDSGGSDLVNDAENGKQTNFALVQGSTNLVQSSTNTGNGTHTIAPGVIPLPLTASPDLGPLRNNGGPTLTLLPHPDSPALGAANPTFSLTSLPPFDTNLLVFDQRGKPRPAAGSGGTPALGAVNPLTLTVGPTAQNLVDAIAAANRRSDHPGTGHRRAGQRRGKGAVAVRGRHAHGRRRLRRQQPAGRQRLAGGAADAAAGPVPRTDHAQRRRHGDAGPRPALRATGPGRRRRRPAAGHRAGALPPAPVRRRGWRSRTPPGGNRCKSPPGRR